MRREAAEGTDTHGGLVLVPDGPRTADTGPDPVTDTGSTEPGASAGVSATPRGANDWALVIAPGSCLAELSAEIARLPPGLTFVEAFGDVDLVLVYRPADAVTTGQDLAGSAADQPAEHGAEAGAPTSGQALEELPAAS